MGACGCGDHAGGWKFPGPSGSWYLLQYYAGCEYCDNGPGWLISRFEGEDLDLWGILDEPDLPLSDNGDVPIWCIEPEEAQQLAANGFEDEDSGLPEVIRAAGATHRRWVEEIANPRRNAGSRFVPIDIVSLESRDPRTGPWHAAYIVCSQCLYSAAGVWPDDHMLQCPKCGDDRVGAWAEPPLVEVAMHRLRRLRDIGPDQCPHCAEIMSAASKREGAIQICSECGLRHERPFCEGEQLP